MENIKDGVSKSKLLQSGFAYFTFFSSFCLLDAGDSEDMGDKRTTK